VSIGIGVAQRRILELLREKRGGFITTAMISRRLGMSYQQAHHAVRGLAERCLVELTLEPNLRVWPVGATEARRSYWRSIDAPYKDQLLRRPRHCGPGCIDFHVGADKTHWA
jgi:DNA-binding IclR family transcriptional regulator